MNDRHLKLKDAIEVVRETVADEYIESTLELRLLDKSFIADVRENVRGEWISHDLENGEKSIDKDCCSVCGERFREIAMTGCEWNFCPNCGADMRGEEA